MSINQEEINFGAFELGYNLLVDQILNPDNDVHLIKNFAGRLGVRECADGLCGSMCVRGYDFIKNNFGLTTNEAYDFVEGVLRAKADIGGNNE